MSALDHLGHELAVGDRVVWTTYGRYPVTHIAEVLEIRKRVKVQPIRRVRGHWAAPEREYPSWTDARCLVAVERFPGDNDEETTK